jgi:hypothetical protein
MAGAEVSLGQGVGEFALNAQLQRTQATMHSDTNNLIMTEKSLGAL